MDAAGAQAAFFANVEPHGAVDAGAGIPPGVGHFAVVRHHGEGVLAAEGEALQGHGETGVAVGVEIQLAAVEGDGGVLIHALELHQNLLARPVGGGGEGLFIGVNAAGEIAVAAGGIGGALLRDLGVVGQGDGCAVAAPAIVERNGFHGGISFFHMADKPTNRH